MSLNWSLNRSDEYYIFRQVKWPSWDIGKDYWQITGGSIELSALSDLKATGSLDFTGTSIPDTHDMIRIYYCCTDQLGEKAEEPIATLFCECAEPSYKADCVEGTLSCYSVLQVLSDKCYGRPYTVVAGTDTVSKAVALCEGLGLKAHAEEISYVLANDHTFEADASYLEIVNWLLTTAGCQACFPNAEGVIQMVKYKEPTERTPSYEFSGGENSIMEPLVTFTNDFSETPNVCRLYYETQSESLYAVTSNIDPDSSASTVARGREKTLRETVSELAGETTEERLESLKKLSKTRLVDNSSEIEYVCFTHAWLPLIPNDAIKINYENLDLLWAGAITNLKITLIPSIPCQLTARRFIRSTIETQTEGGVLYVAQDSDA